MTEPCFVRSTEPKGRRRQAALWKMLDDAPDQEQRDSLTDVLRIEKW
jgi:hypothetical protein